MSIITPAYLLNLPPVAQILGGSGSLSTQAGVLTDTSATITGLTSTAGFYPGMAVYGPNIQYSSAVITVNSATSITLNQTATTSGTFVLSFPVPATFQLTGTLNSTTTITGISATGAITVGAAISGTGIPVGTTVTAISNTSITISQSSTVSGVETLSFSITSFIQSIIDAAQKVMEDFVGFPFHIQQQMEFYSGNGYRDIVLRRPYVSNVYSVSLDFITGGAYGQFGLTTITGATVTSGSPTVTVPSSS